MWETIFYAAVCIVGVMALGISLRNLFTITLQTIPPTIRSGPLVSVLIPARNEEDHLKDCVCSLLSQNYSSFEILVYDDQSTDTTWDIIQDLRSLDSRIRGIRGGSVPTGWHGKNHALHRLAQASTGDILLFTDADTMHTPDSIALAVTNLTRHRVDFLSGYPEQLLPNIPTALVVASIFFSQVFLTPFWLQRRSALPLFGFMIGQYVCIRRTAYEAVGGYAAIPDAITDDIHMARLLVRHGFKQVFLDLRGMVSCRMYETADQAITGITRNIIDFFDGHLLLPLFLIPIVLLLLVSPPFILIGMILITPSTVSPLLYFGVFSLFLAWASVITYHRFPFRVALLSIITYLLIIFMFFRGIQVIATNRGFLWKDRIVK